MLLSEMQNLYRNWIKENFGLINKCDIKKYEVAKSLYFAKSVGLLVDLSKVIYIKSICWVK